MKTYYRVNFNKCITFNECISFSEYSSVPKDEIDVMFIRYAFGCLLYMCNVVAGESIYAAGALSLFCSYT